MAMLLDSGDLARALAAETPNGLERRPLTGVSIDSRAVEPGHVFVGLKGANVHGQAFAGAALEKGAAAVVVEDRAAAAGLGPRVLVVPDAEEALRQGARATRALLRVPLLAVTGTNGKTTTKEVVATVLDATMGPVHWSRGNLNSQVGLPMNLLATPAEATAGVFELGMSKAGEIDRTAGVLRPTVGLVTTIGEAHLETMGCVENIVDAKAELLAHLPQGGLLLLNADAPYHDEFARRFAPRGRVLQVGVTAGSSPRGLDAELLDALAAFSSASGRLVVHGRDLGQVRLPIAGLHMASAFLFAALAAVELGVDAERLPEALGRCRPAWGRMETKIVDGVRLIFDGYNANPSSMLAALRHLASLKDGGRFAVLGEMRELGPAHDRGHMNVAREAARLLGADRVYLFGEAYGEAATASKARRYTELGALAEALRRDLSPGDTLLMKASRGVGIERLLPLLFPPAPRETPVGDQYVR